MRRAQRSRARLRFCSLPPAPLSGMLALEIRAKLQRCGSWHPCRVGNHGLVLVLCMHLRGCAADACRSHKCRAVQSLRRSFAGCAEPTQPTVCSAVARLKQNTCGSRQLGFGVFSGQCYLEMDAVLVMFSGQVSWLQEDCQVYCFSPFLLSPEQ